MTSAWLECLDIQREPFSDPRRKLGMVPVGACACVGMDKHREVATVGDEIGDDRAELCGGEDVQFEHGHRMRTFFVLYVLFRFSYIGNGKKKAERIRDRPTGLSQKVYARTSGNSRRTASYRAFAYFT
jgi:hypothetical protein